MASTWSTADATGLEKADKELAAAVAHLKKLLQARNWLSCPLLRLPTEIIVHIVSYAMEEMAHSLVWRPIINTCHRIRKVMCTSTELWRKVDFGSDRLAMLAFERSQGNPEVILADLLPDGDDWWTQNDWRFCRETIGLHGHRLHTLEVNGYPSHLADFSWIFERPLPRLERLKIHFTEEWKSFSMLNPVALQLPMNLPLRVLDLCNAILPWSSHLFTGLKELHLDFRHCDAFVEISEEDMLAVFEASPGLESLSLYELLPKLDPKRGYTPSRVVKFASLKCLVLDSFPKLIGYILDHMDIPTIERLKIRAEFSSWEVKPSLNYFFLDNALPGRLFPNPPIFEVSPDCGDGIYDVLRVNIGNCNIEFNFDMDENEIASDTIMACILPMVPSSVTTLKIDYSPSDENANWTGFFLLHPEVRSIECSIRDAVNESLWNALSPTKTGGLTLCPYHYSTASWNGKLRGSDSDASDCGRWMRGWLALLVSLWMRYKSFTRQPSRRGGCVLSSQWMD